MPLSTFAPAYYTGTASIATDVPTTADVAIDGVGYMVDWKRYGRRIVPPNLEQRDLSQREPGELSLSQEGFRLRSRSNWDLGCGQLYVDRPDSLEGMFWRSQGIDVFDRNQACLLNDTELAESDAATAMWVFEVAGYTYFITGTTVRHTTDPHAETISWTTVTGITGTITGVTTDGNRVFIARSGSTLLSATVGAGSAAAFGALTPDDVEYANGRLIGLEGADLYEIDNSGAKPSGANIWSHPKTGAVWQKIVSTPIGIFAALDFEVSGVAAGRVQFFHMTTNDATGALSAPTFAGELPVGETIHAMERYNRVLLLGTSKGIRVAEYGNNNQQVGTLDVERLLPVHDNAGDVIDGNPISVKCFDGAGEFIWFGWSGFDSSYSGLGRLDLSRTTVADELVPPYASDLMASSGVNDDTLDVATVAGKRLFCISGSGLWRETGDKVASGWLEDGLITFGLTHAKAMASLRYGTKTDGQSTSQGTVQIDLTTESGETIGFGPYGTNLDRGSIDVDLVGRDIMLKSTLARASGDTTLGPCLRHWTAEAFPQMSVSYEILVPIVAKSNITSNQGNKQAQSTLEIFERFDEMARGLRKTITYQEGKRTERCRVRSVEIIPGDAIGLVGPRHQREWLNALVMVRLFTRPTTTL